MGAFSKQYMRIRCAAAVTVNGLCKAKSNSLLEEHNS